MKRTYLFLVVLALMVFASVDASAACKVCRFHQGTWLCPTVAEGATFCDFGGGDDCTEVGTCPALNHASLATQYTIASVERLDEQRIVAPANSVKTARLSNKR